MENRKTITAANLFESIKKGLNCSQKIEPINALPQLPPHQGGAIHKEWKVIRDEEDEDELINADWLVVDQSGELIANVHGRTVGDCISNADLIASAPRLQQLNRDMDFAIRRLLRVFTPSPTAGIVDEVERKNAIFQQSIERSEAVEAAKSLISWRKSEP